MNKLISKTTNKQGVPVYALTTQPKVKSRKEDVESIDFFSHAKYKHPELGRLLFHVANESQSAPQYRRKIAQMGVTSGVADYVLLKRSGDYPYAVFELKRERKRDSSVSAEQNEFLTQAMSEGAFVNKEGFIMEYFIIYIALMVGVAFTGVAYVGLNEIIDKRTGAGWLRPFTGRVIATSAVIGFGLSYLIFA